MSDNEHIPPDNKQTQVEGLATLIVLADEIRKLSNLREFAFFSTNETHRLIPYHTAYLWQKSEFIGVQLIMQSGTAEIDIHAPMNQWVKHIISNIADSASAKEIHQVDIEKQTFHDANENWSELVPPHLLWCPLLDKANRITGGLIFVREYAFSDGEIKMLSWLISGYQYTWQALKAHTIQPNWERFKDKPHLIVLSIIVLAILFFPVRLSVIGTGTVTPKTPIAINAPMQGIIKTIAVEPGKNIIKGELLFSMDKTDLQSSAEVSEKDVLLTQTKLRAVINEGFTNKESNAEVPILQAQLAIDQSHLDYTNEQLAKADVKSPIDGIVIFDNKEQWIGQPVRTGERILVVADSHLVAVKITIPVSDMIKLDKGADGDFFLYGDLNPLPIRVKTLGYNAKILPNRVLGYQLEADFVGKQVDVPQIGAQGTVKVYSHYVPFIYYLLRKPLQAMRQTLGI
jgi:hypothetical protein